MAKLIDLFNEREPELYNYVKYPYKEDGDTQPYRYTTLDKAEPIKNTFFEDQSNPVSLSARRDFNRMFQFSKSAKGLVFLGKQAFLQTGNTFAQTRLYNPLNVQIHSVPFVHLPRHVDLKKIRELFSGGSDNEGKYARLQKETATKVTNLANIRAQRKGGILNTDINFQPQTSGLFGRVRNTFNDTISGFVSGYRALGSDPTSDRPEINWYNTMLNPDNAKYHVWVDEDGKKYIDLENKLDKQDAPQDRFYPGSPKTFGVVNKWVHDFAPDTNPRVTYKTKYQKSVQDFKPKNQKYAEEVNNYLRDTGKRISIASPGTPSNGLFTAYSRDPGTGPYSYTTARPDYYQDLTQIGSIISNPTSPTDVDSIDVIFSVRDSQPVRFRAFLEDLSETVTPSYSENKYIGRHEIVYTYDKVTRDVNFKLTLHAFSKEELNHLHQKMTYLTKLAYPEVTNNYLTPRIFKITIGKIFNREECIIQTLTHNIENDVSWDINEQLPMTFTSNIGIRLLNITGLTTG